MSFTKAFETAEFQRRVSDVKNRMANAGLDLLICQDPANMSWLTGFDGWSFYTPQAVIVHVNQEQPIWFGRAQDAKSAVITTDLSLDNIISFSERLVHHSEEHAFDELCELVKSRGWENARIGVELDSLYYTARAHQHIIKGLPTATVMDSGELVNWARLVKSDAELVYMREAGQLITKVMNEAISLLKPGVPENEIVGEIYRSQMRGIGGKHGDYASCVPLIQVGEGTSTPHLTWTSDPLPESGLVVMELAGVRRHYHAPLSRTISIGRPNDEVRRLADAIVEGGDAALAAAKAGSIVEEIEAKWQAILRKHGYRKDSRVGYSIGINFPPDWGEKTVSLRPGEKTVLQSGMCFHFQSGVWLRDFGVAISESFVVTETGGERLANVDRRLFTVD